MKLRTDVVKMYKEIHGWVGIISGLALFIAFYAGAITMFEVPLQRWATPPSSLAAPVSVERAPELIAKVIATHPEAAKGYEVHLATGPEQPARVSWSVGGRGDDEHGPRKTFYAALAPDGSLQVEQTGPSAVAQFIDVLHQQVGLPFEHEVAMPIMGAIALLYAIALVSGIIVLLPSLVKDLFAMRVGKNVKRMWLDVHNVIGVFSLPFHLIMAFTAVVFAFHDQFYDAQGATFAHSSDRPEVSAPPVEERAVLDPAQVAARLEHELPGFTLQTLAYGKDRSGSPSLRAMVDDPRYGLRAPTYTVTTLDPFTGEITNADYLPTRQDGWGAAITSFFALHFGSFGGSGVRWAYFFLGLAGAFLFYTGNLLWVESRRKKERKSGAVEQTRATRLLGALTVGVPLGCIAGIAQTVAAAKPLGISATPGLHSAIYYIVFLGMIAWALWRGAARAAQELIPVTALSMLLIPLSSLVMLGGHPPLMPIVDLTAIAGAGILHLSWMSTRARTRNGARDSVWSTNLSPKPINVRTPPAN